MSSRRLPPHSTTLSFYWLEPTVLFCFEKEQKGRADRFASRKLIHAEGSFASKEKIWVWVQIFEGAQTIFEKAVLSASATSFENKKINFCFQTKNVYSSWLMAVKFLHSYQPVIQLAVTKFPWLAVKLWESETIRQRRKMEQEKWNNSVKSLKAISSERKTYEKVEGKETDITTRLANCMQRG